MGTLFVKFEKILDILRDLRRAIKNLNLFLKIQKISSNFEI